MNKQELIEKLKTIEGYDSSRYYIAMNDVFKLVEQLDEPQKVMIPRFIADWIVQAKEDGYNIAGAINEAPRGAVDDWLELENVDIFAEAWINGYTIEKEKRYTVKIKGISEKDCYLRLGRNTSLWFFGGFACDGSCEQTRKQLEEAGFGWVFDCPGIEIEEVE